jgi:membrane associated rhomboid family serine protease
LGTGSGVVSKQGRNLALAIISGLVFGIATWGVDIGGGVPLTYLFLQANSLVYRGWYWQLLSSIFVATPDVLGVADVLFNALAVVWLDNLLAAAFSPRQYYATFILSALAGNILSLLAGPELISFGASGGIFGLLAGAVSEDYAAERRVNGGLLAWFLLVFIFSSFSSGYVNWMAHLGGAVFGLIAGYILGIRGRGSVV